MLLAYCKQESNLNDAIILFIEFIDGFFFLLLITRGKKNISITIEKNSLFEIIFKFGIEYMQMNN